jgi:hypothetical protein
MVGDWEIRKFENCGCGKFGVAGIISLVLELSFL